MHIATPPMLARARALAADPVDRALLELQPLYNASFAELAALRVGDVRGETLRFGRHAFRLVPRARRVVEPLAAGRPGDAALLGPDAAALRARVEALLAAAGAPAGTLLIPRDASVAGLLHLSETERGVLQVVRDRQGLWLLADALPQSLRSWNGEPTRYVQFWSHLDALLPPAPKLLLLGGGAFVGARWLEERYLPSRLDVVEWDPRCAELAAHFFEWTPGPATTVHLADAVEFVRAPGSYDAVVHDIVDGVTGAAPTFAAPGFVEHLAAQAKVVLVNVIDTLEGPNAAATESALRQVGLSTITRVPVHSRALDVVQNVLLIAR